MSAFAPCIIIPNYNHASGFADRVNTLLAHQLPLIIVNDGSDVATRMMLQEIEQAHAEVELIHFNENCGKGAAVIAGLRRAHERGFSHALQIDADGQHALEDLPKFLECSRQNPESMICGNPVYDASVPLHRLLCRRITHFWVWVETLSFDIKDSMCGYRLYPLAITQRVLEKYRLGQRMDFDIEILVKMYWEKTGMIFLPTRVDYPVNGLSNFRLWQDNWLITNMHIRLFLGMLPRIPALLFDRQQSRTTRHWAGIAEVGSSAGLKLMFWVYRNLGKWIFLLLLHPVILYFLLSNSDARRCSRQYLRQLADFRHQPAKTGLFTVYRHFHAFGISAVDKIGAWTGEIGRRDVIVHGEELFNEIADARQGAIFIGSHLGNLELCRALGEKGGRFRINALVFNKNALKFQALMRLCSPDTEMNLIHVESISIDTAIMLREKVNAGEIIIIVGDRLSVKSTGRVYHADFLGKKAPFAEGPFILASLLECPVYLIFCIKEAETYHVYLERFARSLKLPRAERSVKLGEKVQEYASRLTWYCTKAPLQWFNFYDFWHSGNDAGVREDQP